MALTVILHIFGSEENCNFDLTKFESNLPSAKLQEWGTVRIPPSKSHCKYIITDVQIK